MLLPVLQITLVLDHIDLLLPLSVKRATNKQISRFEISVEIRYGVKMNPYHNRDKIRLRTACFSNMHVPFESAHIILRDY